MSEVQAVRVATDVMTMVIRQLAQLLALAAAGSSSRSSSPVQQHPPPAVRGVGQCSIEASGAVQGESELHAATNGHWPLRQRRAFQTLRLRYVGSAR